MGSNFRDKQNSHVLGGPLRFSSIASGSPAEFQDTIVITSRDQVVNLPAFAAGAHVHLSPRWIGTASYAVAVNFMVGSIMPGSGFYISTVNSVGFGGGAGTATASVEVSYHISLRS